MRRRIDTRQAIVEAASALIAEAGPDGFSASSLARAAGVSKANLFHHFESLDAIVLEAFEQFALGFDFLTPAADMTFRDWLIGIGQAQFGLGDAPLKLGRGYFVFVCKALFEEPLRLRVLGTVNLASQALADVVALLCEGEMDRAEVVALANLILMTGDGMAMHLQAFPERQAETLRAWQMFVDRIAPRENDRGETP